MSEWRLMRVRTCLWLAPADDTYVPYSKFWGEDVVGSLVWVKRSQFPYFSYVIIANGPARGHHCDDANFERFRVLTTLEELALTEIDVPSVGELVGDGSRKYLGTSQT